jgi:glycogen debranching enzyme
VIVLDGSTFFSSDEVGDVHADGKGGLYYEDVRHLSRWLIRLDDRPLSKLTSRRVDYYCARFVGIREGEADSAPVSVARDRFVSEGVHEQVELRNLTSEPRRARLELRYASDFADVFEVEAGKRPRPRHWHAASSRSTTLWSERGGYRRGTALTFGKRGRIGADRAVFEVSLGPRASWALPIEITPIVDGARRPPLHREAAFGTHPPKLKLSIGDWLAEAPELETEDGSLKLIYRRSLLDLASLRMRPRGRVSLTAAAPGGGIPWFMTLFGRDSIIAAYELVPFHLEAAQATLEALAQLQADEWDDYRDAQPGKILHEWRRGTLAALGKEPHTPYYGSHDSTPLWLILLEEYERWSGDTRFVRQMESAARAALGWLEGPADLDGDGYLEYVKRSRADRALDNHCWKDSSDSIRFADGRLAEPPIAACELQGYAYDARLRTARLMREIWKDEATAERLERDAAELKRRFNRDFWIAHGRRYALALDRDKQQVDATVSNMGHLLWSGIVDPRRAQTVVCRLLREDMFSGWGIRTMSTRDRGYNPIGYHRGTVWPHDTAIAAAGMRRYGFHDEAARVCMALFDAAGAFDHRLPEVFSGFERDSTGTPVEYPGALTPQSWAAGAPLLALRTMLGLGVERGRLRSQPHLPPSVRRLRLRGVHVRGKRFDTR